ncbi:MAG: PrsW family intramembrane metalloprotease [Chloroflexi bacterium]|nr:PrsW family intramembrane metalloprotease [Chloroflexota bacterium]
MGVLIIVLIALLGAALPTLFYLNLVWWLDRYEREPIRLLTAAFLWGALPAVLFVFVPEIVFDAINAAVFGTGTLASVLSNAVSPPFFEESAKGVFLIALLLVFWRHMDDPLDGIVYGSMVGFGFAMSENILYFLSAASESGVGGELVNIGLRAIVFGLNHAFFTSWTGLALGWARTHYGAFHRMVVPVLGWLTAIFFHAMHNLGATFAEATSCVSFMIAIVFDWGGVLLLTVLAFMFIGRERQWLVAELQPEVASGLISEHDYNILTSSLRRASARLNALLSHGWSAYESTGRFFATATDLAFTKHQLREYGEERGNSAEIALLRQRLQAMKQQ